MGTVHARSLEPLPVGGPDFGALGEEAEFVEVEPESKQEILENKDFPLDRHICTGIMWQRRKSRERLLSPLTDLAPPTVQQFSMPTHSCLVGQAGYNSWFFFNSFPCLCTLRLGHQTGLGGSSHRAQAERWGLPAWTQVIALQELLASPGAAGRPQRLCLCQWPAYLGTCGLWASPTASMSAEPQGTFLCLRQHLTGATLPRPLSQVMRKSHEAREKLLRLGIFRQVDVLIDTCQGDDALPNGLDVTFEVTELRRLTGSYNTMVGNNEGSMVLGLKLPNLLGRAEKVTFQFSYGTKETSYGLSFFKPQPGNFNRNFSVNLYKVTGQFPWSSLRETDRGLSAEYSFPIWKTSHTVKWEGVWRELGCLSRTASFAVRKESGHSLKSSLSHAMVIDSRNSSILPRKGALLKINQELAGYTGGDVSFLKEDFELQLNKQLALDSVISASLWGGMLVPMGEKPSSIADRFYLGGPTSVRGFSMHSIGPQSEGDYLGGEAYWAGGLHLYTPLPFRPGQGGFGELFRTHFFLNAGNLCNLNYGEGPKAHIRKLAECIRWSYGAGIVLRLGNIARLELNYCIPMGVQGGDRICDGVQFGAGIRFL
ncbi:sorting and assembly machinery component 50 homolog [Echinops telfairi]|uniref:Sorting and assembly machinery component 50 homolog n=1 Tax=Echinops telfairi TaxID=9371 RepID=A0AC55D4P7_ECHTE|nr:sorting and assembly machinery component 50 homolog [Echinops telfairi]